MQWPDWYLDEHAHAGDEHLDPAYAASYDRKAATEPTPDVALLRELGLNARSVLVDFGAGTGAFALAAAPHCRRVVAVDVSPAMLTAIGAKAARLGATNVETERAGFLTYDHRDELADFVYSRNALHHLPDFWKALALVRVAAMLRPGGIFYLRDLVFAFDPSEADSAIAAWLAAAPTRPDEGWTRAELIEHVRGEYSTFGWILEPMLQRAGFAIRDVRVNRSRTHSAYICVKN